MNECDTISTLIPICDRPPKFEHLGSPNSLNPNYCSRECNQASVYSCQFVGSSCSKICAPMFELSDVWMVNWFKHRSKNNAPMFKKVIKLLARSNLWSNRGSQGLNADICIIHSNIKQVNIERSYIIAPMFECRSATDGNQCRCFSGCRGADK